jgi:hypothetical protein
MSIGQLLDLGKAQTLLASIIGMRDGCETRLMQPQTQGFRVDAKQSTNLRKRKEIQRKDSFQEMRSTFQESAPQQMSSRNSQGNARQS